MVPQRPFLIPRDRPFWCLGAGGGPRVGVGVRQVRLLRVLGDVWGLGVLFRGCCGILFVFSLWSGCLGVVALCCLSDRGWFFLMDDMATGGTGL